MKTKGIAVTLATFGVGVLLPLAAAAQMAGPSTLEDSPPTLELALPLSGIDAWRREAAGDAFTLSIAGGKVGADRLAAGGIERPSPWVLYARCYVLNFQNNLGEQKLAESRVGFGRTGPALAGRIYVGIRKTF